MDQRPASGWVSCRSPSLSSATLVGVELVEQTSGVALVGLVGHPAALYQLREAALEKSTAALDQLGSGGGQAQPASVASALEPRRLNKLRSRTVTIRLVEGSVWPSHRARSCWLPFVL